MRLVDVLISNNYLIFIIYYAIFLYWILFIIFNLLLNEFGV